MSKISFETDELAFEAPTGSRTQNASVIEETKGSSQ